MYRALVAAFAAVVAVAVVAYAQLVDPGATAIVNGIMAPCTPYHLAGGTTASTNSTNIRSTAGRLCTLIAINTTTTLYYLKVYDTTTTPTCSSATGIKHVFPIPFGTSNSGSGFILPIPAGGETYASGVGFCVTGGGGDTDNTNAATGVYIEASHRAPP